jgi:acyl-CoA synthetase (AMP-forming)/AMP-acid ligase II
MLPNAGTLPGILSRQTSSREEHPLLVCDSERISYAEADRRSARLARGLIALGAGKGTHVGLMYPNGTDFVVAMFAAARIGAVVVPFSTFGTAREIGEQLADSDAEILLATATYRSHDYTQRLTQVLFDASLDSDDRLFSTAAPQLRHVAFSYAAGPAGPARDIEGVCELGDTIDETLLQAMENDVEESDLLAIVYTSGSAGAPKGVVHTHAALLEHQRNLNEVRGLRASDTLFCNSPFFWIGGFGFGLLATVVAGSTLVCSNASDAGVTLDLLEAERPTIANGFAAAIARLAQHSSFATRDLSSVRRGNLYPIMAADVRPADPELRHNMLGMTEAGSTVLLSGAETDQPEYRRGSFGKPAPGFETTVIDPETGGVVAPGQVGELCIRGPHVMQQYHKRRREECFDADGWFHTGDLFRTDEDGFYYFISRRDSMIKTAGANVSPPEVEKAIAKVTAGTISYVVGLPDTGRGQVVAAAIVVEDGTEFDESGLRAALKSELAVYKIPTRFAALQRSAVPMLSSGKVDLHQLKKVFDA